jgi:spore coat protein JB
MTEREALLKRVQACDFVLYDTALFLDTNPTNRQALAHYQKYQALRREAASQYTRKYGPLTHNDYDGGSRWDWVDSPWPWQRKEA